MPKSQQQRQSPRRDTGRTTEGAGSLQRKGIQAGATRASGRAASGTGRADDDRDLRRGRTRTDRETSLDLPVEPAALRRRPSAQPSDRVAPAAFRRPERGLTLDGESPRGRTRGIEEVQLGGSRGGAKTDGARGAVEPVRQGRGPENLPGPRRKPVARGVQDAEDARGARMKPGVADGKPPRRASERSSARTASTSTTLRRTGTGGGSAAGGRGRAEGAATTGKTKGGEGSTASSTRTRSTAASRKTRTTR